MNSEEVSDEGIDIFNLIIEKIQGLDSNSFYLLS